MQLHGACVALRIICAIFCIVIKWTRNATIQLTIVHTVFDQFWTVPLVYLDRHMSIHVLGDPISKLECSFKEKYKVI